MTIYRATYLSKDDGHMVRLSEDLYSCDDRNNLYDFLCAKYGRDDINIVPVPVVHVDADKVFDLKEGQRFARLAADHMRKAGLAQ